jgi:peptide/nickel transport system substrate-binding protein
MDPHAQNESPSFCVLRNVYDPLMDLDAGMRLVPCLAVTWKNDAPTTWTFTLRKGVKFHEGQPLTAADVAWSIERALHDPRSRVASEIQSVASTDAINTFTLRITTRRPDAILPTRLAQILIMCRASNEAGIAREGDAYPATHANGTGAYRLAEWRKDETCALEANPAYWGGAPQVTRLEFIPTSNEATRMAMLERGAIDVMVGVPPRGVAVAERDADYAVVEQPSLRLIYLGLDSGRDRSPGIVEPKDRNPLKDTRVRRALALGIDNRLIVKAIMDGHAVAADQLMPPGVTGYDPALRLDRPDYAKAKALLAEAGYPNGFAIRLDGPNDRYVNDARILSAVAQELARIGVRVSVNAQPKARFFSEERAGRCSFFLSGWSNTNGDGAPTFENLLHSPDPAENLGGANASTNYSNKRIDEIVGQAAGQFDGAKRAALLREANRLAMTDLPHIPLHYQMDIYAVRKNIDWFPRRDTQIRGVDLRLRNGAAAQIAPSLTAVPAEWHPPRKIRE